MPATWKILGAWALVILPKVVGLNTFAAGWPKLGWLRTLKASSRRVKASCSIQRETAAQGRIDIEELRAYEAIARGVSVGSVWVLRELGDVKGVWIDALSRAGVGMSTGGRANDGSDFPVIGRSGWSDHDCGHFGR